MPPPPPHTHTHIGKELYGWLSTCVEFDAISWCFCFFPMDYRIINLYHFRITALSRLSPWSWLYSRSQERHRKNNNKNACGIRVFLNQVRVKATWLVLRNSSDSYLSSYQIQWKSLMGSERIGIIFNKQVLSPRLWSSGRGHGLGWYKEKWTTS